MFIVKPKNIDSSIKWHHCHSKQIADLVYSYITNKYSDEMIIEEKEGNVFYDCPGMKLVTEYMNKHVTVGFVDTTHYDLGMFLDCIKFNFPYDSRGFHRISCHYYLLCFSPDEISSLKKEISNFEKLDEEIEQEFKKSLKEISKND